MQLATIVLFFLQSFEGSGSVFARVDVEVNRLYEVCKNTRSNVRIRATVKARSTTMCGVICARTEWCRAITVCPDTSRGQGYTCELHAGIHEGTCETFRPDNNCKLLLEDIKSREPISPEGCHNGGMWNGNNCTCMAGFSPPNCFDYIKDCHEGQLLQYKNSPWSWNNVPTIIHPDGADRPMEVLCNYNEGKVIVLQRDKNVVVNFNRTWLDYKYIFGPTMFTHWIGLENIYQLTKSGNYDLQVYFVTNQGSHQIFYKNFRLGPEKDGYRLYYKNASIEQCPEGLVDGSDTSNPLGTATGTLRPFCTWDRKSPECYNTFEDGGWWHSVESTPYSLTKLEFPLSIPFNDTIFHPKTVSLQLYK
ncbi:hypothetical protein SNE40_011401 [Patella caerulea]|uniref:Fibrinogen C-terminal domain-containing protein n=1 Tax=Patella caerulea TaxID=87958 RepID=A0AAN8JN17_PATCE